MTVISRRCVVPIVGKSELAIERTGKLVGMMNRLGAAARARRVVMGDGAGSIEIYGLFASFSAGTKMNQALSADPEFKAFNEEREKNPSATLSGPYVYRTVYGEPTAQHVSVQRLYKMSRANLKNALALLPEAKEVLGSRVGVSASIPVFAPDMDSLIIVYHVDSLDSLGETLDGPGTSEAFQNVVTKAAQFGTLFASRVLTAF